VAVERTESPRDRAWIIPLTRSAVALVAAVIITFNANHSPLLGLLVFGGFAVLTGVLVLVFALLWLTGVVRTLFAAIGGVGVVTGVAALLLHSGGLGWFLTLVSLWAVVTGVLELYAGIRSRRRLPAARDWMTIGGLSVLMAIVFLLVPPDFAKHYVEEGDQTLTSAVILVGVFGAYAAIVCVYLAIGGFSLKWGAQDQAVEEAGPDGAEGSGGTGEPGDADRAGGPDRRGADERRKGVS